MKEAISWANLACLEHANRHEEQTGMVRSVALTYGINNNCVGRRAFSSRCKELLLCL